ncbi:MFS transporter [Streptomyces capparidis]
MLLTPVSAAFGGSRTDISSAYSVSLLVSAAVGVPVGRIVDRRGARAVLVCGCLAGAVSLAALAASPGLGVFFLVWAFGIGTTMALTLYPVTFVVVTNWFDRRRGRAMALLTTLGGLASPLCVPLSGWLISTWSWRTALAVLALAQLAMVPVAAVFVRRRPEDLGLRPDGESAAGSGPPAAPPAGHAPGQAVRSAAFWCLTSAGCAAMLAATALQVHQVPYMISKGLSPVPASAVSGLAGLASIPARLVLNTFADRVESRRLLCVSVGAMAVSAVVLCVADSTWMFVVYALLFGAGYGGFNPLRATALGDQFGRLHFGAVTAWQNAAVFPAAAVGPALTGLLFDVSGGYLPGLLAVVGCTALAVVAAALTPAPKPRRET